MHLVTLPPSGNGGPGVLWERFASVLGIDPGLATMPERPRNTSLGAAEAELLRRVNERLDHSLDWPQYRSAIAHSLVETLAERPGLVPLTLPEHVRPWVSAHADAMAAELSDLSLDVVGDLADLQVSAFDTPGRPAGEPVDLLEAALDTLTAVLAPGWVPPVRPAAAPPTPEPEPSAAELPALAPAGRRAWWPWRRASRADLTRRGAADPGVLVPTEPSPR
jgi:hypothetical protein